jgi:hypothetical protein
VPAYHLCAPIVHCPRPSGCPRPTLEHIWQRVLSTTWDHKTVLLDTRVVFAWFVPCLMAPGRRIKSSASDEAETMYNQIAGRARRNYTARHSTFTPCGVSGRSAVALAREVALVRAQVTLPPGQTEPTTLHDRYGDQLVCVRYRYDAARQRRLNDRMDRRGGPLAPCTRQAHRGRDGWGPRRGARSRRAAAGQTGGREVESGAPCLEIAACAGMQLG